MPTGDCLPPILCLPGLVRTGADFELAGTGDWHRPPRHRDRLPRPRRLRPRRRHHPLCAGGLPARYHGRCAALHFHHAVVIGTSFGGLLTMGLAAARPSLMRAVVLNDIGPDIGTEGAEFVRDFVGDDPALESLDACVTFLRADLPPLSLDTDAAWRRMAELTYQPGADGRWHPVWDTRIAQLLNAPAARPVAAVRRAGACSGSAGPRRGQQHPAARHRVAHAGGPPGHDGRSRCPASAMRRS